MKITLIGNMISSLLPSLMADMYFAMKADGMFAIYEKNPALGELIKAYADSVRPGSVSVHGDLINALKNANAVVFADSEQALSRFEMDLSALSGENEGDAGLRNQARVHDGIEGLMFTLRTGEKALQLIDAMRKACPDATVINLSKPNTQITALFHMQGFHAVGLAEGIVRGKHGLEGLCHAINKKQSLICYRAAGLYRFQWLVSLTESASGKNLMPLAEDAVKKGAMGEDKKLFLSWYDAVPIGEGHGESLPENSAFTPDLEPAFGESIDTRKERIMHMNAVAQKGLKSPEGTLAQLTLLKAAPPYRPVQYLLAPEDYQLPIIRLNDGALRELPKSAFIFAPYGQHDLSLPIGAADITSEVSQSLLDQAKAATGDREALRDFIENAPCLAGLDRLYLASLITQLIALNQDVLPRFAPD